VHDRVEVQVEVGALDQPGADHGLVQRGQEGSLALVGQPVGVGGKGGGLGQGDQAGEQGSTGVGGQVIDVACPADPDQLQCQQRQQVVDRGDDAGAWVAGGADQGGQVQGDQLGHGQQQPGHPGLGPGGQLLEVHHLGAGQQLASGQAPLGLGSWPQAREALGGQDLGDPGAVERGALGGQHRGDLVGRAALLAQLDDAGPGRLLGRRDLGSWPGGNKELLRSGAKVAHRRQQRLGGVAKGAGDLGCWPPLVQVGPQRLVAAVGGALRLGEELASRPGWG
jgi:hypothetical protein